MARKVIIIRLRKTFEDNWLEMAVLSEMNRLKVSGEFAAEDCSRFLAAVHSITQQRSYSDITMDFSHCTKAFSAEMLLVCAQSLILWQNSIDVELILPSDKKLSSLFINANWAHLIDFRQYDQSRWRGYTHAPAIRFNNGDEQKSAVDKILEILLAAIKQFRREEIRYIEWVINELMDNVTNHAQSSIGGLVQVTNHRHREQIELVVADSGVGIPTSLRSGNLEFSTDTEALDKAIREGVTRDKKFGQGNGLYGSWSISQKTNGSLQIKSGYGMLDSDADGEVCISKSNIPLNGTLVKIRIGYSAKFNLSDALVFSGKIHTPVDYIETKYESDEVGNVIFILKNESKGFGSRHAGEPIRRILLNVFNNMSGDTLTVDLDGVPFVSSSYADEVFGKFFVELGPLKFMRFVKLVNVDELVQKLIDRAILQRSAESLT